MVKIISKSYLGFLIISLIAIALVFALQKSQIFSGNKSGERMEALNEDSTFQAEELSVSVEEGIGTEIKDFSSDEIEKNIPVVETSLKVPFVLQAPFANWSDPLFQDACEEAAIMMAKGWLDGKINFAKEQMDNEIRRIAELEKRRLGGYVDSSANDTALILREYAGYEKVRVDENIKLEDIKNEIAEGNLVILPTDGRKLKNPYYNSPGPITHMIVVVGYDSIRKEFITNDSGTRNGESYRYGENVLYGAVRDYPTGSHYQNPINEENVEKTMIVISRK